MLINGTEPVIVEVPKTRDVYVEFGKVPILTKAGLWVGEGPPPDTIIGAKIGDEYVDSITGNVYTLTTG